MHASAAIDVIPGDRNLNPWGYFLSKEDLKIKKKIT